MTIAIIEEVFSLAVSKYVESEIDDDTVQDWATELFKCAEGRKRMREEQEPSQPTPSPEKIEEGP